MKNQFSDCKLYSIGILNGDFAPLAMIGTDYCRNIFSQKNRNIRESNNVLVKSLRYNTAKHQDLSPARQRNYFAVGLLFSFVLTGTN